MSNPNPADFKKMVDSKIEKFRQDESSKSVSYQKEKAQDSSKQKRTPRKSKETSGNTARTRQKASPKKSNAKSHKETKPFVRPDRLSQRAFQNHSGLISLRKSLSKTYDSKTIQSKEKN